MSVLDFPPQYVSIFALTSFVAVIDDINHVAFKKGPESGTMRNEQNIIVQSAHAPQIQVLSDSMQVSDT